jgi:hypothetical protein
MQIAVSAVDRARAFLCGALTQPRRSPLSDCFEAEIVQVRDSVTDLKKDSQQQVRREAIQAGEYHETAQAGETMNALALRLPLGRDGGAFHG